MRQQVCRSCPISVVLVWAGLTLTGCGGNESPTDPAASGERGRPGPPGCGIVSGHGHHHEQPRSGWIRGDGGWWCRRHGRGEWLGDHQDVPSGSHTVSLAGIAPNCALEGQICPRRSRSPRGTRRTFRVPSPAPTRRAEDPCEALGEGGGGSASMNARRVRYDRPASRGRLPRLFTRWNPDRFFRTG